MLTTQGQPQVQSAFCKSNNISIKDPLAKFSWGCKKVSGDDFSRAGMVTKLC
jgi:hypothetical protein